VLSFKRGFIVLLAACGEGIGDGQDKRGRGGDSGNGKQKAKSFLVSLRNGGDGHRTAWETTRQPSQLKGIDGREGRLEAGQKGPHRDPKKKNKDPAKLDPYLYSSIVT